MSSEVCTLGGGCFWCLDGAFRRVRGVQSVMSGYAGGSLPNPGYEQVCSGNTGHAEVVQVTFDTEVISFREILEIFFTLHDPTTLDRQGADVGTQYRSIILYHNDEQKRTSEEVIRTLEQSGQLRDPVVTRVEPLDIFYEAEPYHQNYFEENPGSGYCQVVIGPKLDKLRRAHPERMS